MDTIVMASVVPQVFSQPDDLVSDVWRQDVRLERGRHYLVEAESGKGKSTFCSYVLGYRRDYSGTIMFDGRDTKGFRVRDWVEIRRKRVSVLFQELRLFPGLTAMENVMLKNRITGFKAESEIRQWFDRLGIGDKADVKVGRMSFGQQQRVAMMRALVQPFDFMLADEPVSHLDDANARIMGELMMEEARKQGAGVIVTSIGRHIPLNYEKTFRL